MLKTKEEKQRGYSNKTHQLIQEIIDCNLRDPKVWNEGEILKYIKKAHKLASVKLLKIKFCHLDIENAAGAAGAAGAAWAAIDFDFDYFVQEFEYLQHEKGNENDIKALKIYQCFFEAKKNGLGYLYELDDVLHLSPDPIIKINENNQHHSRTQPAIIFDENQKLYFLEGVNFKEDLWKKITQKTITPEEIFKINNQEQKSIAMRYYGYENLFNDSDAKIISEEPININGVTETYRVIEVDLRDDDVPARFVQVQCWSTNRRFLIRVDPRLEETKTPLGALAWTAGLDSAKEYILQQET